MIPLLTYLENINSLLPGLKERLFDWTVDMTQSQFDQLCREIIGLHDFRQKYNGLLVTDQKDPLRPFLSLLPKVEFQIILDDRYYNRRLFYRWLSTVDDSVLAAVCNELEGLFMEVVDNANTYIIAAMESDLQKHTGWWRIECSPIQYLPEILSTVLGWREKSTVQNSPHLFR